MWALRARGLGSAAFGGLLLAGCSWVGIGDGAPKPPLMIQPNAQAGDVPQGLGTEGGKRTYADRPVLADVTVVRPLRTEAGLPKVAPDPATQSAKLASSGVALPSAPPAVPADSMQSLESFEPTRYGVTYLAASLPFGHGSTQLSAADHALVRGVAAQYKKTGGALTVIGHASSCTGNMSALEHKLTNCDISVRHAEAVARDLIRLGVPARAVYVGAVSDNNELVSREVMPQGEAYNRRTEIFLNY